MEEKPTQTPPPANPTTPPPATQTTTPVQTTESNPTSTAQTTPPPPAKETNSSTAPKGGMKSKMILILVVILLIIILAAGGMFFMRMRANTPAPVPDQTLETTEEISPEPTPVSSTSATTTYTNAVSMWKMDYPSDQNFKAEKRPATQVGPNGLDEAVVFSMLGPTQTDGTEFHDGISFTVGVKKKTAAQTVMQFADEDSKPDPETTTRTPLKAIDVNGLEGVETTVSGLGTFRFVYLEYPGKTDRVYYLAIFSEGPGESNAKYDGITEAMLQSFYSTSDSE